MAIDREVVDGEKVRIGDERQKRVHHHEEDNRPQARKKTAAPGSPPPAKKVVWESQKATSAAKGSVAAAGRAAESKKSGSGSASRSVQDREPAAARRGLGDVDVAGVDRGPGRQRCGRGPRTTFTPKPKPPATVRPKTGPYAKDAKFLDEMRELLQGERVIYQEQATSLRAEADSLASNVNLVSVQFDEESGEGGTVTVDRERNLALSGQATVAVEEIDAAQVRIDEKTYGYCERCFQPIPKPRLRLSALCPALRGVQERRAVVLLPVPERSRTPLLRSSWSPIW